MLNNEQIQAAVDNIVVALRPKKVILFGSYARGNASKDSDLDLMVIEPTSAKNEWESMLIGRDAAGRINASPEIGIDILVYDEDTFEQRKNWCSSPIHWAHIEGRVLYEKH